VSEQLARPRLEFAVRATESSKEIDAGSHSRVVTDVAKFIAPARTNNASPASAAVACGGILHKVAEEDGFEPLVLGEK
jgi:hypothetical protein